MNRRHFIRQASLAMGTTAWSLSIGAQPAQKLRIAVVGLGSFSGYCLPRIMRSTKSVVSGLVSSDVAKAKNIAHKYGIKSKFIYTMGPMTKFEIILRSMLFTSLLQ